MLGSWDFENIWNQTYLKSARVKNFSLILYFFARNLTFDKIYSYKT